VSRSADKLSERKNPNKQFALLLYSCYRRKGINVSYTYSIASLLPRKAHLVRSAPGDSFRDLEEIEGERK